MRERSALLRVQKPPVLERAVTARWRRTRRTAGVVVALPLRPSPTSPPLPAARGSAQVVRSGVVLLLAALAGLGAWHWSASEDSFSERLSEGCEQIEPCRQLETEAARRAQSCWLGCGRELSEHRMARSLRYRAQERTAVREHYRQRDDAERNEQEQERDQKLAQWQREQAAQRADAEREQRQVLELERLRQDRIDQRLAEERRRRVAYLTLIGPQARAQRLEHCRSEPAGCETLVLDLIEAAPEVAEKRKLAELNEQPLQTAAHATQLAAPKPSPVTPNS